MKKGLLLLMVVVLSVFRLAAVAVVVAIKQK